MDTTAIATESLPSQLRALLGAIARYQREHGYAPSIRDLQGMLRISSCSVVVYRLRRLEERGLIRRDPRIPRSIRVVGGREGAAA